MARFPFGFTTEHIISNPTYDKIMDYLFGNLDIGNSAIIVFSDYDKQIKLEPGCELLIAAIALAFGTVEQRITDTQQKTFEQMMQAAKRLFHGVTIYAHIMVIESDARAVFKNANPGDFHQSHLWEAAHYLSAFGWQAKLFAGRFIPHVDTDEGGTSPSPVKSILCDGFTGTEAIVEILHHAGSIYSHLSELEKQGTWAAIETFHQQTIGRKEYDLPLDGSGHPGEDQFMERYNNAFEGEEDTKA